MIVLTEQQQRELAKSGWPPQLVNPATGETFVLVHTEMFDRVRAILEQEDEIAAVKEMAPLVGDVLDRFVLWLGDEVDRRLVLVLGEMAIDAVVTGVDPAADEPSPERWIARIKRDVPGPVPVKKVSVLLEAVRDVIQTESIKDCFVC